MSRYERIGLGDKKVQEIARRMAETPSGRKFGEQRRVSSQMEERKGSGPYEVHAVIPVVRV
jgi:hypothetical protein